MKYKIHRPLTVSNGSRSKFLSLIDRYEKRMTRIFEEVFRRSARKAKKSFMESLSDVD